jgi:hypothetical protein
MTIVRRRLTPAQAESRLQSLREREAHMRLYADRRASGLCVRCGAPASTWLCEVHSLADKIVRAARAA